MRGKSIVINGATFTPYFTETGYTVGYQPVMGENSTTLLSGDTYRDELAQKAIITLPCMPLNEEQMQDLISTVFTTPYCQVMYFEPRIRDYRIISAYRSLSTQKYRGYGSDGLEYWTGTVLTLEER